jgi:hypothetical protein
MRKSIGLLNLAAYKSYGTLCFAITRGIIDLREMAANLLANPNGDFGS